MPQHAFYNIDECDTFGRICLLFIMYITSILHVSPVASRHATDRAATWSAETIGEEPEVFFIAN